MPPGFEGCRYSGFNLFDPDECLILELKPEGITDSTA
jgi:hypothetical protein